MHAYLKVMKTNAGFTLIEVLVAVIILAGGLLGLAALQAKSLSNNLSAYSRSQATHLAYDIADKMRANPSAALTPAAGYLGPIPENCPNGANPNTCTACTSSATPCSSLQLAQKDLFDWGRDLTAALPNQGVGQIILNNGVYTVTITWNDDKNNNNNLSFTMGFRL